MRTKLRGKFTLLFMTFAVLLAVPAIALADDIRDGLDTTAQQTQTITAGGPTSTGFTNQYWIVANGAGTSPSGCDVLAEGDNITATFAVNTPSAVTASVSSLTFDECREGSDLNSKTVKFTSNTPGTYTIPALTKTGGTGAYTNTNTPFTLVVNDNCPGGDTSGNLQDGKCTSNTAPQVSVSGVNNGGNYEFGSEPTARCDVTDAEDANESADPVIDRNALNNYGLGTVTVKCSYTDAGNLSDSDQVSYKIVDTTAPVIAGHSDVIAEATGSAGANVSYTSPRATDAVDSNVNVSCSPASGSKFSLGNTTVTCTATDAAGNDAQPTTFKVTVEDTTPPALNLPSNITEEATGPNGNVVAYNATSTDLVDGSVNVNCTPASGGTFHIETTTVNCSATDAAGNTSRDSFTVKVQDTIAPSNIQFVGNIDDDDSFFFGDAPAQPTCTATDSGSGLNAAGCVVTGYKTAVGTHTLTATATDKAGNTATKEISYTVKPYTLNGFYQPIDMNDTVNTVKNGSTVPVKFELFKGTTELTSTSAVTSILAKQINCAAFNGDPIDDIETLATGGTSLRYDATAGQFVFNWTTPKGASQVGKCYSLTMTAADNSTITAYFKLK
jgi:hypothetical protein